MNYGEKIRITSIRIEEQTFDLPEAIYVPRELIDGFDNAALLKYVLVDVIGGEELAKKVTNKNS